jgi:hypothetical protein
VCINDDREMNANASDPYTRSPQAGTLLNKLLLSKSHISNHSGVRLRASLSKVFVYSAWVFL